MPALRSVPGKGKQTFLFHNGDGYYYHVNKLTRTCHNARMVAYLRCIHYNVQKCHGTAILKAQPEGRPHFTSNQLHTCQCNHNFHLVKELKHKILEVCRNRPYADRNEVVNTLAALYNNDDVAAQVTPNVMRRAMQRAASVQHPAVPNSFEQLDNILENPQYENITATEGGQQSFYSGMVGPEKEKAMIFVSPRVADKMRDIRTVYIDGTFKPSPSVPKCEQVLQIVALEKNRVIPLVQIIMEARTYEAYECAFEHLLTIIPRFRPRIIVTDFEPALQRACRNVFRNCIVRGCYWHYTRALLKRAKKYRLQTLARADRRVRSLIRCCSSIPLLPKNYMRRALCVVIRKAQQAGVLGNLARFFAYIIKTWLTGSRFDTLSVYEADYRTNNACESANKMLRKLTGPHHPSIWLFLNAIRKYEYSAHITLLAISQHRLSNRTRRAAAILNDAVIQDATARLMSGNMSIFRFLRRTSQSVYNVFQREFLH